MQKLPQSFFKDGFNRNMHLYVTSNRRYRFKCDLVKPHGKPVRITGFKQKQSCKEYLSAAHLLHLVQQGDDTFYVTWYDEFRMETGGYPGARKCPSRYVTKVWRYADFPQVFVIENG